MTNKFTRMRPPAVTVRTLPPPVIAAVVLAAPEVTLRLGGFVDGINSGWADICNPMTGALFLGTLTAGICALKSPWARLRNVATFTFTKGITGIYNLGLLSAGSEMVAGAAADEPRRMGHGMFLGAVLMATRYLGERVLTPWFSKAGADLHPATLSGLILFSHAADEVASLAILVRRASEYLLT